MPSTDISSSELLVKTTGTIDPMDSPSASAAPRSTAMPVSDNWAGAGPTHSGDRTSSSTAPSTPVTRTGRPPMFAWPVCQPLTAATSGSAPIRSRMSPGSPPRVNVWESTTRSERTRPETSESIDAVNDDRNTASPATTAVANMRAPVVAAVRDRLRMASRDPMRRSAIGFVGTSRIPAATA